MCIRDRSRRGRASDLSRGYSDTAQRSRCAAPSSRQRPPPNSPPSKHRRPTCTPPRRRPGSVAPCATAAPGCPSRAPGRNPCGARQGRRASAAPSAQAGAGRLRRPWARCARLFWGGYQHRKSANFTTKLPQHWARDWRALALTQVHHGSRLSDSCEGGEALSSVHPPTPATGKLIHNLLCDAV